MAKTDLTIPSLGDKFIDLRDGITGDSYTWSWERDLSQVNYLAIHQTSGLDTQTPQDIANIHININGWGGIGYHFLIARDGIVYYAGDISTARANVANLNEQVIGIGLIGNFTQGRIPASEQLDSCHKLCEFLLNYPDLSNLNSWDKVRGHKELPNQTTNCPGDDWPAFRIQIVEGLPAMQAQALQAGMQPAEAEKPQDQLEILKSQIESLQTSLASVNQQAIFLQEALQERDQEISELKKQIRDQSMGIPETSVIRHSDSTLTMIQALVNLYKFALLPRKES